MSKPILHLLSSLILLTLAGCGDTASYDDAPADQRPPVKVGDKVIVEFRRDALGTSYQLPAPLHTEKMENSIYALRGEVAELRPGWILLRQDETSPAGQADSWIPLSAVLMIDKQ